MSIHNRIAAALPKTSRYESALRMAPLVGGAVGGLVVGELVLAPGGLVVGELVGGEVTWAAEVTPISAKSPFVNCATKPCA